MKTCPKCQSFLQPTVVEKDGKKEIINACLRCHPELFNLPKGLKEVYHGPRQEC
ncbi:MAG: hypothetical protein U5L76_00280 [Patescibacteria group bacterium]|nr:hypothetical protein [Patescibacteria group bacterium]